MYDIDEASSNELTERVSIQPFQVLEKTYPLKTRCLIPYAFSGIFRYGSGLSEELTEIICRGLHELDIIQFPMTRFNRFKVRFSNPKIEQK